MKFYLCGAIDFASDAVSWRQQLIDDLPEHEFINPMDVSLEICDHIYTVEGVKHILSKYAAKADTEQNSIWLENMQNIGNNIIDRDLANLLECDAVIFYDNGDPVFGSICEVFFANWMGKPVYLVTAKKYTELSIWCIALIKQKFSTLDALIDFLNI